MAKPFHVRLAEWRRRDGSTQEACADAIGVTQTTWSRYEAGEITPRRPARFCIEQLTSGAVKAVDA